MGKISWTIPLIIERKCYETENDKQEWFYASGNGHRRNDHRDSVSADGAEYPENTGHCG